MLKNIIAIAVIVTLILVPSFAETKSSTKDTVKSTSKTTTQEKTTQKTTSSNMESSSIALSTLTLEELTTGKTVTLDLSKSKSLIVLLNKESMKDYKNVSSFEKWLQKEKSEVKVYTIITANSMDEAKSWVKSHKISSALFDKTGELVKQWKVEKYPVAYYVANGKVVSKTEKLDVENLKKSVWCEHCKTTKENCKCSK